MLKAVCTGPTWNFYFNLFITGSNTIRRYNIIISIKNKIICVGIRQSQNVFRWWLRVWRTLSEVIGKQWRLRFPEPQVIAIKIHDVSNLGACEKICLVGASHLPRSGWNTEKPYLHK
jgi:hypothetical protein